MLDVKKVRMDFPILATRQHGHPLIYLDNAATMQMPMPVLERISSHYHAENGNVHRGVHSLSQKSTDALERSREITADFIGASPDEVIFTSGTTDSFNLLSRMLESSIRSGQQIIVSSMEHHSNLIPWQELCRRTGAFLSIIPMDKGCNLDLDSLQRLLRSDTALVAITLTSNVTGTVNPVSEIAMMAHSAGALAVVDAAQGMRLGKTDVAALGCDFMAFSGHKLGALTGIGVLYGKSDFLRRISPVRFGGGMVREVSYRSATYGNPPHRFEAGTPNYVGAISLAAAINYMKRLGLSDIAAHEQALTDRLVALLSAMPEVTVIGSQGRRCGVVSFVVPGVHPFDLGVMLDSLGIAVRTGHMCAQPLVNALGYDSVIRVSPAFYNTEEELESFAAALKKLVPLLKGDAT